MMMMIVGDGDDGGGDDDDVYKHFLLPALVQKTIMSTVALAPSTTRTSSHPQADIKQRQQLLILLMLVELKGSEHVAIIQQAAGP